MPQKISKRWELLKAGTSWRPLSSPGNADFYRKYDAVIASTPQGQGGRGNSYEVYTFGEIVAERPTLASAKNYVETVYGPLEWKRVALDPVTITHNYYGPSTEWSEPLTIYVVDKLPSL